MSATVIPFDNDPSWWEGLEDPSHVRKTDALAGEGGTVTTKPVPELLRFTAADLLAPIEPERYLVPGMVPTEAYTLIAGALSAAKTTLLHTLMLWRATGYDVAGIGGPDDCIEVGPCVLLNYEDGDRRLMRRFQILVQQQHGKIIAIHGKHAAAEYLARIEQNLARRTLTGSADAGIVCRCDGRVIPNDRTIDELLQAVRGFASEGVMIGLDPLRLALVGSQNDDDGADVAVHTLNRIATSLPHTGIVVASHTTKSQAKGENGGGGMAESAYATSGSALYSQHARSNFHLVRLKSEEMRNDFPPDTFSEVEIEGQLATQLTHGRLSHGAEGQRRYFAMRSGVLEGVRPLSGSTSVVDLMDMRLQPLVEAIDRLHLSGLKVSQRELREDRVLVTAVGGKQKARDLTEMAVRQGWLEQIGSGKATDIHVTPAGRNRAGTRPHSSSMED